MRALIAAIIITVPIWCWAGEEKKCEDCPPGKPCTYSVKSSCNTCSGTTYCIAGQWYGQVFSCTTMWCGPPPIANPFKERNTNDLLQ